MSGATTQSGRARLAESSVVFALIALVEACEPAASSCASPRESWSVQVPTPDVDEVDLLLVIDNSESMVEEQAALVAELPRVVQALASGDRDADGVRDFDPVLSLHVGLVTTDMGAGRNTDVPSCAAGLGDDGILLARSDSTSETCVSTYPSGVFMFDAERDDAADFATTIGCVASVGTSGCRFEQPLEAALKALTPSTTSLWTRPGYSPPRFTGPDGAPHMLPGHGDAANLGFLRPDSVLAIVFVTDEDDCSLRDDVLLSTDDPRFATIPDELRCSTFAAPSMGFLQTLDRYVNGLLGLRTDPSRLVLSGIVGIPPDTEPRADIGDYSGILVQPSMTERPNAAGTELVPSCSTANGSATPPVRFVQTLAGLAAAGVRVSLSSICSPSFERALDRTLAQVADAVNPRCLPRPVHVHEDGRVRCDVFELLSPGESGAASGCTSLPGRELVDVVGTGMSAQERCRIRQLSRDDLTGPGWYYDDEALNSDIAELCGPTPQRVVLHELEVAAYARASFECSVPYLGGTGDFVCDGDDDLCNVGWLCEVDATGAASDLCARSRLGGTAPLVCDAVDHACAVPCARDEDCEPLGFGFLCDGRTNAHAAGSRSDELPGVLRGRVRGICVSSTCGG